MKDEHDESSLERKLLRFRHRQPIGKPQPQLPFPDPRRPGVGDGAKLAVIASLTVGLVLALWWANGRAVPTFIALGAWVSAVGYVTR